MAKDHLESVLHLPRGSGIYIVMTTLRIGLIGVGKHGSRYAKHIVEDIPQAELVAVCRRDQLAGEAFASTYSCLYYADYRRLLDDPRIDAVVVVVPPARHG